MRTLRFLTLLAAACALGAPASASAQELARPEPVAERSATSALAVAALPAELVPAIRPGELHREGLLEALPVLPQARSRNRAGMPLMIAGGIAFGAGLIAGGDAGTILMLGGAGVGAFGAYVYFKG